MPSQVEVKLFLFPGTLLERCLVLFGESSLISGSIDLRLRSSQAHSLKLRPSQTHSLLLFLSLFKMSTSKDNWKPEETRYFFQLYAEERRKGNKVGQQMNKVGKKNIMDAFELRFKKGFSDWKRDYKNKYDSSRKKYIRIRMLTQNRTGLGYDNMGRIDMSDDWWKERERECPGIRKAFCKEIDNMDMFEAEFGGVVVTGAEGWSAQHGEASLNSRVGGDIAEDEADSQPAAETETQGQAPRQTQPAAQTHSGGSRAKRRRKEKDVAVEACEKRTAALEVKNMLAKQLMEREQPFSVETV
uniref:Myb/SANT-like domain-containing protein n=1 Tax=Brassica oleracea var. oleracea TaxID=109376 RepID=A0A0D3AU95_BRAOL